MEMEAIWMFGRILNTHGRDEKSTLHIVPSSKEVIRPPRRDFIVSTNKPQAKFRQTDIKRALYSGFDCIPILRCHNIISFRYYVTPICVIVAESTKCIVNEYDAQHPYTVILPIQLWSNKAAEMAALAITHKIRENSSSSGADIQPNDCRPLPIKSVCYSLFQS
jgi:hypothetical protein